MANKRVGRGTVLFGLFVLLVGLVGAVVLYLQSQQRTDDAIRDLARAPVGCDTTLSFSDTGTFYVYIEHLGTLERLDGDCETPDEYSRDADDPPTVEIVVLDSDDEEIDLDRLDEEFTYSLDDSFAGTATRQLEIESTGDYVVAVDSDEEDFVVAVGRDPGDAGTTMRWGAIASAVAGIVLGLGLVLVGVRRARRMRRVTTIYTARPESPVGPPLATSPPMMQPPPTQPLPAPRQPGEGAPVQPVGPPVWSPANPPSPPYAPAIPAPGPGPTAAPHVFAPPGMPNPPMSPPSTGPIVPPAPPPRDASAPRDSSTGGPGDDRDHGVDVRGDASP
jgi:hypothetical protein